MFLFLLTATSCCSVWRRFATRENEKIFCDVADWIRDAGGLVDERLTLGVGARSGVRGVITKEQIPLSDVVAAPLIVVPESLEVSGSRARAMLALPSEARTLDGLDDGALCVLWLASQRVRDAETFWSPYIATLPEEPPCAWWRHDHDKSEWSEDVEMAAKYAERVARGLEGDYGKYLGVDRDVLLWALGMVNSRSMTSASTTMVPLLDLVNHDATASAFTSFDSVAYNANLRQTPYLSERYARQVDGDDWALWSFDSDNRTPRPLDKSDELCANYLCPDYTDFDWWLNAGFVP